MSNDPFTTSTEHDLILPNLHQALGDIGQVVKSREASDVFAGGGGYRYATLSDVLHAVKTACTAHQLAVTQNVTATSTEHGDYLCVTTTIIHESGQWVTFPPAMCKVGGDPQKLGSATTYLRRYALVSIFAIPTVDDDGAEATRAIHDEAAQLADAATNAKAVYDRLKHLSEAEQASLREFAAGYPDRRFTMADMTANPGWCSLVADYLDTLS